MGEDKKIPPQTATRTVSSNSSGDGRDVVVLVFLTMFLMIYVVWIVVV